MTLSPAAPLRETYRYTPRLPQAALARMSRAPKEYRTKRKAMEVVLTAIARHIVAETRTPGVLKSEAAAWAEYVGHLVNGTLRAGAKAPDGTDWGIRTRVEYR